MVDYFQLENKFVENLFQKKYGKLDALSPLKENQYLKDFQVRLNKDLNQNWKDTSKKIIYFNEENLLREKLYNDTPIEKANKEAIILKESYFHDFEYNPNELISSQLRNKWLKQVYPKDDMNKKKKFLKNLLEFKGKDIKIIDLLKKFTEKKILNFLEKSPSAIHRLLREIYVNKIYSFKQKKKPYKPIKIKNTNKDIQHPNLNSSNFQDEILLKKEFLDHKIKNLLIKNMDNVFTKTSTQKLLMNFISPNTPYNSLLIWHGVGTGKTCSAISIAEQFKNRMIFFKKKILIILPGSILKDNWINEIFNVKKQLDNDMKSVQCTENNYLNYFVNLKKNYINEEKEKKKYFSEAEIDAMTTQEIKRKLKDKNVVSAKVKEELYKQQYIKLLKYLNNQMKKYIEEFYEITTYGKITNFLKEKLFNKTEKEKIDFIRKNYSDRLIIMDEIHGQNDVKMNKLANNYLEFICRYGENNKLILLSATPIRDHTAEILSILNLILLNERKPTISIGDFFEKKNNQNEEKVIYSLKDNKKNDFEKIIEGYISYLRGSDPETFPVKLYPDWKNTNKKVYIPREIEKDLKEKNISLELSPIKCFGNQNTVYLRNYQEKITEKTKLTQSEFANIILPGSKNLNNLLKNPDQLKNILKDNLKTTSPKFFNILSEIQKCKGISFVFSQYTEKGYGMKALAVILELHGFNRLTEDSKKNFTNNGKKQNSPENLNYIYLTSQTSDEKKNKLINLCKSTDNKNGENIRVILGSEAVEQGISFFNVRQIHITEPWWNFSKIEQAIGRGVRNFSHINLEKSKNNVMIFLHCTPNTIDEEMYYYAYLKKKAIMEVEKIMKEKSIDKCINLDINYIGDDKPIFIKDCYEKKGNYVVRDLDYSFECNLDICNYQLQKKRCDEKIFGITLNDKSFMLDNVKVNFIQYKYFIENLYNDNYFYTFEELENKIKEIFELDIEIDISQYLSFALDKLIKDKEILYIKDQKGFLIYRNKYYIFQPIFSSNIEEADLEMPLYHRMISYRKNNEFNINQLGFQVEQGDTDESSDEDEDDDQTLYDKFRIKYDEIDYFVDTNFVKYIRQLPDKYQVNSVNLFQWTDILKIVVKFYLLDNLLFNEKKIIFTNILNEIKHRKIHNLFEKGKSNIENIKTYFKNFLKNPENDIFYIFIWYYAKNINNTAFNEYCVFFEEEKFRLYDENANMKVYDFNGEVKSKKTIKHFDQSAFNKIKTHNFEVGYLQSSRNKYYETVKNQERELLAKQTGKNAKKTDCLDKFKRLYTNSNNPEGKFMMFNHIYNPNEIYVESDKRKGNSGALCNSNNNGLENYIGFIPYINQLTKEMEITSMDDDLYKSEIKPKPNGKFKIEHDWKQPKYKVIDNRNDIFHLNQTDNNKNFKGTYIKTLCNEVQFLLRMKHLLRSNKDIKEDKMYFLQSIYLYFTFKN